MEFPHGLSQMSVSAALTHEYYKTLREAGFTRPEALYIVTRPTVEMVRLEWAAARADGGNPL